MKLSLLLLLMFSLLSPDLADYRKLLDTALDDEKAANRFYEQFKNVKSTDAPVMIGFKAMSEFMRCRHLLNPISRVRHFNRGKNLLEEALARDKNDAELIFFRFTTQCNVPSLLNYNSNIKTDKNQLIAYLKSQANHSPGDKDLFKRIKKYLLSNSHCTAEEKTLIKAL